MAVDKRLTFLDGKHVLLKVLEPSDIEGSDWVGWLNNPREAAFHQHHYFPTTFDMQREFLSGLSGRRDKLQLGVVEKNRPDSMCGVVSLSSIDLVHRRAEIGGLQSEETSGNPAVFGESWSLMLRHAFVELGLNKVYGGTFHPHVAGALARLFNFAIEGTLSRHVFFSGELRDVTSIAVFSDTVTYPEF